MATPGLASGGRPEEGAIYAAHSEEFAEVARVGQRMWRRRRRVFFPATCGRLRVSTFLVRNSEVMCLHCNTLASDFVFRCPTASFVYLRTFPSWNLSHLTCSFLASSSFLIRCRRISEPFFPLIPSRYFESRFLNFASIELTKHYIRYFLVMPPKVLFPGTTGSTR